MATKFNYVGTSNFDCAVAVGTRGGKANYGVLRVANGSAKIQVGKQASEYDATVATTPVALSYAANVINGYVKKGAVAGKNLLLILPNDAAIRTFKLRGSLSKMNFEEAIDDQRTDWMTDDLWEGLYGPALNDFAEAVVAAHEAGVNVGVLKRMNLRYWTLLGEDTENLIDGQEVVLKNGVVEGTDIHAENNALSGKFEVSIRVARYKDKERRAALIERKGKSQDLENLRKMDDELSKTLPNRRVEAEVSEEDASDLFALEA